MNKKSVFNKSIFFEHWAVKLQFKSKIDAWQQQLKSNWLIMSLVNFVKIYMRTICMLRHHLDTKKTTQSKVVKNGKSRQQQLRSRKSFLLISSPTFFSIWEQFTYVWMARHGKLTFSKPFNVHWAVCSSLFLHEFTKKNNLSRERSSTKFICSCSETRKMNKDRPCEA